MQKIYNVSKNLKYFIIFPLVFILIGVCFNVFRGVDLSIEFRGGTKIVYSYKGDIDTNKVQASVEKALSEAGNETNLQYTYEGTIDSSAVEQKLADTVKDITLTADTTVKNNIYYLNVASTGKALMTQKNIDSITSALNSNFADNKIKYSSKTENKYQKTKVDVSKSTDYTTGTKSIAISVVGNLSISTSQLEQIDSTLKADFKDTNLKQSSVNTVDATIGSGFFAKSMYAVIIASILVVAYVGYRFRKVGGLKAGITALVALVHDLFFVYFTSVIFGLSIDTNFIAVVLTILGYSLNDTIVIYDRVRENSVIYGSKKSIREIVDMAISQSLKRSIVTSITTFVAILSVTVVAAIAGLDSILTFSVPMSFGIISGSFSSICIAGPLYVFWCEHNEKKGTLKKEKNRVEGKAAKDYTNKINPKNSKKKVY